MRTRYRCVLLVALTVSFVSVSFTGASGATRTLRAVSSSNGTTLPAPDCRIRSEPIATGPATFVS